MGPEIAAGISLADLETMDLSSTEARAVFQTAVTRKGTLDKETRKVLADKIVGKTDPKLMTKDDIVKGGEFVADIGLDKAGVKELLAMDDIAEAISPQAVRRMPLADVSVADLSRLPEKARMEVPLKQFAATKEGRQQIRAVLGCGSECQPFLVSMTVCVDESATADEILSTVAEATSAIAGADAPKIRNTQEAESGSCGNEVARRRLEGTETAAGDGFTQTEVAVTQSATTADAAAAISTTTASAAFSGGTLVGTPIQIVVEDTADSAGPAAQVDVETTADVLANILTGGACLATFKLASFATCVLGCVVTLL
jgi:hypothetical protein